ncbi:CHAT domain-containing protein [Nocardia nepalensis]|uniref:CHAT domain-containing protein n=1 Tax=Nocardia nepalensis TaxID=3375448 RepID=UPI003B672C4F
MTDRDAALAAVRYRIEDAATRGDASELLSVAATNDAAALAAHCDLDTDVEAAYALGWFHWLPTEIGGTALLSSDELAVVVRYFAVVYDQDPDAVPDAIRRGLEDANPPRVRALDQRAEALYGQYLESHDMEVLREAVDSARQAVAATPTDDLFSPGRLSTLSTLLLALSDADPTDDLLPELLDVTRAAVAGSAQVGIRYAAVDNLPGILWRIYVKTEGVEYLERAVIAAYEFMRSEPEELRLLDMQEYANLLVELFDRTQDPNVGVNLAWMLIELGKIRPPDNPRLAAHLAATLAAQLDRAVRPNGRLDVQEAIVALLSCAVEDAASDPALAARCRRLLELAQELLARLRHALFEGGVGEHTPGQTFIAAVRDTYYLTVPVDDPTYGSRLINYSHFLATIAYEHQGFPELLDEAVRAAEEVAARAQAGEEFKAAQGTVAIARHRRFQAAGRPADLDGALDALNRVIHELAPDDRGRQELVQYRKAVTTTVPESVPPGWPDNPAAHQWVSAIDSTDEPNRLFGLMHNLLVRVLELDDIDAAERAIGYGLRAAELYPDGHPRLADTFGAISSLHGLTRSKGLGAADAAVDAAERALTYTPEHDVRRRAENLATLSVALQARGKPGDIARAAKSTRESLELFEGSGPSEIQAVTISNVIYTGFLAGDRLEMASALADLDHIFEAVIDTPSSAGHDDLTVSVALLWGEAAAEIPLPSYLDKATNTAQRAVEICVASSKIEVPTVLELARLAWRRALKPLLRPTDLSIAEVAVRSLLSRSLNDTERAECQFQLGQVLQLRYASSMDLELLDESVSLLRAALQSSLSEARKRQLLQPALALSLQTRAENELDDHNDLDEAVALYADAVADRSAAQPDVPDIHARLLHGYGNVLWQRYQRSNDIADLNAAITAQASAVAELPEDEPHRAEVHGDLAKAVHRRFIDMGEHADPDDWERARQAWQRAWDTPGASLDALISIARRWGTATAQVGDPAAGADILARGVSLLPALAWRDMHWADRCEILHSAGKGLIQNATAAAIAAGQLERAIELAESGRGILWAQISQIRADLTGLRAVARELADDFDRYAALLDGRQAEFDQESVSANIADLRAESAYRFENLLTDIRQLAPSEKFPHPSRFLLPKLLPDLRPNGPDEWIVLLNSSELRCDAVAFSSDRLIPIPLPHLTEAEVTRQAELHAASLRRFATSAHNTTEALLLDAGLTRTLEWLWTEIAAPIFNKLGITTASTAGPWPRIWWYPTGVLATLPVHAAGYHNDGMGNTVIDRVISSRATSLTGLADARGTVSPPTPADDMAVVAVPDTPGRSPLPSVIAEVGLLAKLIGAETHTVLIGEDATKVAFLNALTDHRWLHICCHGYQDLFDPRKAGLFPHDWQDAGLVGIEDLIGNGSHRGEFALLSACDTTAAGAHSLDESATLAAALQSRGWRHVIGTMWEVWDDAALHICEGFYPRVLRTGLLEADNAAAALHETIRTLRDANPQSPRSWAPFVHLGP